MLTDMTVHACWPDRRAMVSDAVLLAAVAALELVLELHDVNMSWAPTMLEIRVPVILGVLLLRRRFPLLALALAVVDCGAQGEVSAALPVAAYALARYDARWSVRVPALVIAALVAVQALIQNGNWGLHEAVIISACFVLWPATLGVLRTARGELMAALVDRAERAEAAQELLAREAVLEERARIAIEMHDVVGHRVSLMVLQAGAVEMAAADSQRVQQLAAQTQVAGRQALQELRQLVGLLRTEGAAQQASLAPQPTLADLATLVEESRMAGMDVTLQPTGQVRVLTETVERTAYRVVQEALTNAGRHAPGGSVAVTLDYRPTALAVSVVNQKATGAPTTVPGRGHGLVGLRERAHALGGQLSADPRLDGGFGVEAVLPA
jgi:signal transduction histidine kinase